MTEFEKLAAVLRKNGDLWNKLPEHATMKECRTFAQKNELKLPKGVKGSKMAFVAMFMYCRMTPVGLVSLQKLKKSGLSKEDQKKLLTLKKETDAKRKVNGKGAKFVQSRAGVKGKSNSKVLKKSSKSKLISAPKVFKIPKASKTSSDDLPFNPATGRKFTSEKEWRLHNTAVNKRFSEKKADDRAKKEVLEDGFPSRFASKDAWHASNKKADKRFLKRMQAKAKASLAKAEKKEEAPKKSKKLSSGKPIDGDVLCDGSSHNTPPPIKFRRRNGFKAPQLGLPNGDHLC